MADIRCEDVWAMLISGDAASPEASAHVAGCARCRAAVGALLAERYAVAPPAEELSCDAMGDLPAFLDCERDAGEAAAAARYPGVWRHLWACPDCAEEARLTRALLDAEAAGALAPPYAAAAAPAPAGPWPPLLLDRAFLHAAIAPQLALGAAWSEGDEATLLAEESMGRYRVALYGRPLEAGIWSLSVRVSPAVRAVAVLRFGAWVFRAPFDSSGTATVDAVPGALLSGRVGPALEVRIEPDEP